MPKFDIEKRVYIAEIKLHLIPGMAQEIGAVKALPRFPAVSRDLALVMDESVEVGPLMAAIRKAAGKLIEDVKLFDIYRGAQLGENKKSVAFALSFRAADRTLADTDIAGAMNKILAVCEKDFAAVIRA